MALSLRARSASPPLIAIPLSLAVHTHSASLRTILREQRSARKPKGDRDRRPPGSSSPELERANQLLRPAQLARPLAARVLERRLKPLEPAMLLRVTEPGHSRVPAAGPVTLRGQVQASKFPEGAISPPFRRALRPLGPLGRRLPESGGNDPGLISGLAEGTVDAGA